MLYKNKKNKNYLKVQDSASANNFTKNRPMYKNALH